MSGLQFILQKRNAVDVADEEDRIARISRLLVRRIGVIDLRYSR